MPVIGSSSIIPSARLGSKGPTGAIGVGITGPTGATGVTGPTGPTGTHVLSSSFIDGDPDLYLNLSDGSQIQVKGLRGATGKVGGATGENLGAGVGVYKQILGATFWFKGITSDGSIVISETENTIGISGDQLKQVGVTADISDMFRFAYLSGGLTADVSGLTFDGSGTMIFGTTGSGNTYSFNPEEIIVSVPSINSNQLVTIYGQIPPAAYDGLTAGKGIGIQLAVTAGSIFDVQTPIGVAGFTGNFDNNETFRFTMLLRGNDIWDWPSNVFFNTGDTYFSCGKDLVGFSTSNSGETWYAQISARGYDTDFCNFYQIGSCCYIGDYGEFKCEDFVTESYCEEKNQSNWSALSTCEISCSGTGLSGVCCSEGGEWNGADTGVCVENVSPIECNYFGGSYWTRYRYIENFKAVNPIQAPPVYIESIVPGGGPYDIECGGPLPCSYFLPGSPRCTEGQSVLYGTLFPNDLCVDPCGPVYACCVSGSCIGDSSGRGDLPPISPVQCRYVYGGTVHLVGDRTAACCLLDECQELTREECSTQGGNFLPNRKCNLADEASCWDDECDPSTCDCDPSTWEQGAGVLACDLVDETTNQLLGSCCKFVFEDGDPQCEDLTETQCRGIGYWGGRGSLCLDGSGIPNETCGVGVCIKPNGECVDENPVNCHSLNGDYYENDSCNDLVPLGCGSIDCCDVIVHAGACCTITDDPLEGACINVVNHSDCDSDSNQIFMGPNTYCIGTNQGVDEVDCCFDLVWCCFNDGECRQSTQAKCDKLGNQSYNTLAQCQSTCTALTMQNDDTTWIVNTDEVNEIIEEEQANSFGSGVCCLKDNNGERTICSELHDKFWCEKQGGIWYPGSTCLDKNCLIDTSDVEIPEKEMTDTETFVRLPNGKCVWMMCSPPDCPYQECN